MREILKCDLCPRRCAVSRRDGDVGYCGAGNVVKVFRWGPHFGEEPPISGECGSGTVFFSHCTLGCLYCQNYPWSAGGQGKEMSVKELENVFRELASAGCHNFNLVTPGPWLPFIHEVSENLKTSGVSLPFVYNTSGYECVDVAERYRNLFDVVLTDLRYSEKSSAESGSFAPDYVERAREFVKWSWDNVGPLELDDSGIAKTGTIVRLLVLPGRANETISSLEWLADTVGTDIDISVMSQYTPVYKALENEEWNRGISAEEYSQVTECVEQLGFENGWVQEFGTPAPEGLLGCSMPEGGFAYNSPYIQKAV